MSGAREELFYERKVSSFARLMREISLLDLDSGIRAYGNYDGKKVFVFLTRSLRGYTAMIYDMASGGKTRVPGKRLFVREFKDLDELREFMRSVLARPVTAFVY